MEFPNTEATLVPSIENDFQISIGQIATYLLFKKIGFGGTCKVYKGKDLVTGQFVAVKIPKAGVTEEEFHEYTKAEVTAMKNFNHPNILKLIDNGKAVLSEKGKNKGEKTYLVFEIVENGELFDYIMHGGSLDPSLAKYYFMQLIDGLKYLHEKGFAHRDLKLQNVLLDKDLNLKIIDFGYSIPLKGKDGTSKLKTQLGTIGYTAPEILRGELYSGTAVDIFASGVMLFIMHAGFPPFNDASLDDKLYSIIASKNAQVFIDTYGQLTPNFSDLIFDLLAYNPEERLTIAAIQKSAWITGDPPIATQKMVTKEMGKRCKKQEVVVEEALKEEAETEELEERSYLSSPLERNPYEGKRMPIYDSKLAKATQFFVESYFGDVVKSIDGLLLRGDGYIKKSKEYDPFIIKYTQLTGIEKEEEPTQFILSISYVRSALFSFDFTRKSGTSKAMVNLYKEIVEHLKKEDIKFCQ
ncbi:hypothetical protein FGO68_gene8293 [Halteria grandinella]|uniref:Protein kinase domain-containing protein n=1 Tax=Halteria grandinella TaxID=5974 RepID=A0A8J8NPU5_HALGN|nr:hypothetical protein FGO68_gene8293 [Halteria grandinella]